MKRTTLPLMIVLLLSIAATLCSQNAPAAIETYVPQKPIAYVYFQGLAKAARSFEGTAIAKILAEPEVLEYRDVVFNLVNDLMKENMEGAPFSFKDVRKLLDCEIVGALMGATPQMPELVFVVRPPDKKSADDLRAFIDRFFERMIPGGAAQVPEENMDGILIKRIGPNAMAWIGDDLLLMVGPTGVRKVVDVAKGLQPSLAIDEDFRKLRAKTGGDGAFLLFQLDIAALMDVAGVPEKPRQLVGSLRSAILTVAPDKPGLHTRIYLHTPGGVKGILELMPAKPLDEKKLLARVPKDARSFSALRMSPAEFYDSLVNLVERFGEKQEFDRGVARVNEVLGMDFRRDFLATLGDEILVNNIGPGLVIIPEFAVTMDVKDEAACRAALQKLLDAAKKNAPAPDPDVPRWERRRAWRNTIVAFEKIDYKGASIDVLKITGGPAPLAPSVALSRGQLIVGLVPQTVKKMLDRQGAQFEPVTANADFAAARSHMAKDLTFIAYADVKPGFESTYGGYLMHFAQMLNGVPEIGPSSVATKLPSSNAIMPHLFGAVWGMSFDGEGFLMEGYGPAGGMLLPVGDVSGSGVATTGIAAGFLLPALAKAKESAHRAACMNNLRQIGLALKQYQADHDDKLPESFADLLKGGYIVTTKVFVCPSFRNRVPADFPTDFKDADMAVLKKIDEFSDYQMAPGVTGSSPYSFILAYDKRSHNGDGRNVLFMDGHVKFHIEPEFQRMLAEQQRRIEEMKR